MPFLTLGGTTYEAQNSAAEPEVTYLGEASRAFDGSYRSGVRGGKRSWTFTMIPMSETDHLAFKSVIGYDVPLTANGDFNNGTAVTVVGRITGVSYIPSGASFMRVMALTLLEV